MNEEKITVKRIKLPSSVLMSVIGIVIGLVLLLFPGQSLDLICRIIGALILVGGIIELVMGLIGSGTMPGSLTIGMGAFIIIVGLFIVVRPDILVSILPFVAGIFLIVHNISSLVNSFSLAGSKYGYWWVGLLLSLLGIVLGVILFFNAHSTAEFIARIVGIFALYNSISSLWISSRKAHVAKVKKQEEDALDVEAKIIE